ncbi:MAG: DUF4188 domain-containing protein [Bacteroidales bacterium]|nr:DUF4188 domain-containing protein [Bacteroidales bacterium]
MIAKTISQPYYAVIFTSFRNKGDDGYGDMGDRMMKLAQKQKGFLGAESVRDEMGITVSYWRDLDAIKKWKENSEHQIAQEIGKKKWYASFKVRVALVERDYEFGV